MQKKFSGIFKSTTISRTFECMTNSRTAEVQAHSRRIQPSSNYFQAVGTFMIFISSTIQGTFLMEIENHFEFQLNEEEFLAQTCVSDNDLGHQQPKDFSYYLYFITIYMTFLSCIFIVFFQTDLERRNIDDDEKEMKIENKC